LAPTSAPRAAPASIPFSIDAQADQGSDLASELDRLGLGQVAQVLDLDLPGRVLVDGQRVDHAYRVRLSQPFELGDDFAVELGVLEPEHDELDRSDGHGRPPSPDARMPHDIRASIVIPLCPSTGGRSSSATD